MAEKTTKTVKKPATIKEKSKPAAMTAKRSTKRSDVIEIDGPFETKIVKGSHLTVITDSTGRTTLEWDDEALLRDVRTAMASVDTKPTVKSKGKAKQ